MEDQITAENVREVLDAVPALTYFGFRSPDSDNYAQERAELVGDRALAEIQFCRDWLRDQAVHTLRAGPRAPSSYWIKHVAERVRGEYIANGSLIVAALLAGVPVKQQGVNARVAVSRKWLDRVSQETPR